MTAVKEASITTQKVLEVLQWPGFGAGSVRTIVEKMFSEGLEATEPKAYAESIFPKKADISLSYVEFAAEKSREILKQCAKLNISVISYLDDGYPCLLRNIRDAPPIIYVQGDLSTLRTTCVAVVGTRKASKLGMNWSKQVGRMLAERDITTVSGLALGIDAAAHLGALEGGGRTVAILAHGLHTVSPATNKKIATDLLDNRGALVSEHPPGTPARGPEFVRRNRIQSGMSMASIVVETNEKGGAMHQAKFTKDQGKDLLVILPGKNVPASDGFTYAGGELLEEKMGGRRIASSGDLLLYLERVELSSEKKNQEFNTSDESGQLGLFE